MVGSFSESSLSASMPLTLNDEEIKPRHVFEVQRVCSLSTCVQKSKRQRATASDAWSHAMSLAKIANYVSEKKRAENSQTDGMTAVQRMELGFEQATCEPNADENTKFKT